MVILETLSKVVAIIPARKGSKWLPNKNKMLLDGEPLIVYTLKTAIGCPFINEILITSDDLDIFRIYTEHFENDHRIDFVFRPDWLAGDDVMMWEVVNHCCLNHDPDTIIILLQPTSPLRTVDDVHKAFTLFNLTRKFGVVSVAYEFPDHEMMINGAIYINYLSTIRSLRAFIFSGMLIYIMPKHRSIDIDTIDDLIKAEMELDKLDEK